MPKNAQKKSNFKRLKLIKKNEKIFSARKYSGKGKKTLEIIRGKSVVAITTSNSIKSSENNYKYVDELSGGLVCSLAKEVGCHGISLRKSFNNSNIAEIENEIENYIIQNNIKISIDIRFVDSNDDSIIFLDKINDEKYSFIQKAIKYSFEYKYKNQNISKIVSEYQNPQNTVMSIAAKRKGIYHFCLRINKKIISIKNKKEFIFFYNVLSDTLTMLSNLDYDAEKIKVYKLLQSSTHKPQDKIEILFSEKNADFENESLLNICTYGYELEKVRLHSPEESTIKLLQNNISNNSEKNKYIFLTNRLIEILFGREWIEGKETIPFLKDAPIIVYSCKKDIYPIGMPKANQIDNISFSSALFDEKKNEAEAFDYVIFNRYSDSRLFVKYDKMNYFDYGRVKTNDGQPAKKIMIPRYHKRLLGYLDYPLKMIRKEEYDTIIKQLDSEEEKYAFKSCYEKIQGEIFYRAKDKFICDNTGTYLADNNAEDKKIKETVIDIQKRLGIYDNVEILRVPKEVKSKEKLFKQLKRKFDKLKISILKVAIGKSEYLLKTEWTSETDDRNNIARLSANMMRLLGVSENDKILVKFGRKQEILRVLVNNELTDYQIGLPAQARKKLGMNSINDIVIVHRDMLHIFLRHSESQTIAILGTILTVYQLTNKIWLGILLCLIVTPLIMYFILNEERVKIK